MCAVLLPLRVLMPVAALALLSGCSADRYDEAVGEGLVPIHLTAVVTSQDNAAATRASNGIQSSQFDANETFYAYFPAGVTVGNTSTGSSATYTADGSGGATPGTQPYLNPALSTATVHAYYGKSGNSYTQVTNSSTSFAVQLDQTSDAGYKASDLLYASATVRKTSSTTATGLLSFEHKMAKLVVNATADEANGVIAITKVRLIGGKRDIAISNGLSCTLGTLGSTGIGSTDDTCIKLYENPSGAVSVTTAGLIPPQTISGNFLEVTVKTSGNLEGKAYFSLNAVKMESGKEYPYSISVRATDIGVTTEIGTWGDAGVAAIHYDGLQMRNVVLSRYAVSLLENVVASVEVTGKHSLGTLTVTSSNESVATASIADNIVSITGHGIGNAVITVADDGGGVYERKESTVSVTVHAALPASFVPGEVRTLQELRSWTDYGVDYSGFVGYYVDAEGYIEPGVTGDEYYATTLPVRGTTAIGVIGAIAKPGNFIEIGTTYKLLVMSMEKSIAGIQFTVPEDYSLANHTPAVSGYNTQHVRNGLALTNAMLDLDEGTTTEEGIRVVTSQTNGFLAAWYAYHYGELKNVAKPDGTSPWFMPSHGQWEVMMGWQTGPDYGYGMGWNAITHMNDYVIKYPSTHSTYPNQIHFQAVRTSTETENDDASVYMLNTQTNPKNNPGSLGSGVKNKSSNYGVAAAFML